MLKTKLLPITLGGLLLMSFAAVIADDDDHKWRFGKQRADFAPLNDPQYQEECGSCHMPYQPGMLPARSWQKIMSTLDDHFGDNAELDAETQSRLTTMLTQNAADKTDIGRAPKVARSLRGQAPLRFSQTRYFQRKHHEISSRMVESNPKIGSFANCNACHGTAIEGNYDEHQVNIPGYGRWED